ncbi:hypothetical protein FHR24_002146 [Wenyingzhuangia heitensis]|uniref:Haem-binding domain-containing protein n=1 Tax=Wenyingzhuangia heitensis TaxID=1487859 RepID=A0ABX0UBL9_9FLAO|nr:heme-binding domain-containing protein [Wenyingzhuangia heitensis]NIJ45678.1 hypothetical protein [Wenyingzhuangia heitensis]
MLKKIGIAVAIILVGIQFVKVDKNEAAIRDIDSFVIDTKANIEVQNILAAKCFDCHSNKTAYPWYAKVAPVSFWINHHVEEGKEHLDFSNWSNYKTKRKKHKLEELVEELEEDKMPLESYEILHGDLTESEQKLLIDWAKATILSY